jgi:hypothetical protein
MIAAQLLVLSMLCANGGNGDELEAGVGPALTQAKPLMASKEPDELKGRRLLDSVRIGMKENEVIKLLGKRPQPFGNFSSDGSKITCMWLNYRVEVTIELSNQRVIEKRILDPPR